MIGKKLEWLRLPAIFLGVCLLLSACAAGTPREDDIGARAQARWDLLLSGELNGAYGFLSPGYRSSVSSISYQRAMLLQKVRWSDAGYIDSECLENTCKVRISLDYVLLQAVPGVPRYDGSKTVEEDWIKSGGQWWFVPKK